ncbi:conserved unknown protein [Ectocarpus siliculosus]|uniref:Uncharacterized protein n=1 Tax=Ectocarpus siliculosus TaxID=2880 RepID=D8LGY0_ECTSI|nr:conserved unknown protein [Ectocarpus siliculosus]|eukprot:CBN75833.1 conserved unknown protein [Ectocarpus siliculosus]
MAVPPAQQQSGGESNQQSGTGTLSDLVKDMVKEMDGDDFYSTTTDLYDESAEEHWFNIDITLEPDGEGLAAGEDPPPPVHAASLRKPWSEFQRLHYLLLADEFGCDEVFSGFLEEHSRRRHRGANKEDEEKESGGDGSAGACSTGEEARKSPETAIDFLLQPFEYGRAYVPRRAEHTESIDVLRGESVVWKFEVLDHLDIDFSVTFRPHPLASSSRRPLEADEDGGRPSTAEEQEEEDRGVLDAGVGLASSPGPRGVGNGGVAASSANGDSSGTEAGRKRSRWWGRSGGCEGAAGDADGGTGGGAVSAPKGETVHLPTRYSTGGGDPVQGSFSCPAAGTCILRWDNAFSRLRGKRLCFVFESVTVQTMQAAIEAAGAADHKRRAARSAAAQTILDSGRGEVKVCVTAVGAADDYGGDEEDVKEVGAAFLALVPRNVMNLPSFHTVERLERSLEETREDLSTVRKTLRETETARDEAAAAAAEASAGLQTSEEQLLRARRQHDLLQAERSVWHVARSGIQEELAKVVAELEQERHRHEDTSRALAKSHESRAHAEAEAARLSRRLEEERGGAGGAREDLASELR